MERYELKWDWKTVIKTRTELVEVVIIIYALGIITGLLMNVKVLHG